MNRNPEYAIQNNAASSLAGLAQSYPDKKILISAHRLRHGKESKIPYHAITYSQLQDNVNALANSLKELGLQKGEKVLVMVPISTELYTIIITLFKMGVIVVFIDPWADLKQMIRCCRLLELKAFIGIRKAHMLRLFSGVFRKIPIKIITDGPALFGENTLHNLLKNNNIEFPTEPVRKEDTALITFTTGSTGIPKGVSRTHGFLLVQRRILSTSMKMDSDDTDLPALPIFVLKNMANNVTSVLPLMNFSKPSDAHPDLIIQQLNDWNVTTSIGSPAFFETVARYCIEKKVKLSKMRAIYTGGGPVTPELMEMLSKILPNGSAYIIYGSTEAEPISLMSAQEVLKETAVLTKQGHGNCVGRPIPDIKVNIIRVNDGPVDFNETGWDKMLMPNGEIGEIVVTGEHVNKDYFKNPQAVKMNKFTDEQGVIWHRTGDIGYFDKKGRIWFVGRIKNRVVREGKHIYPLQIEPLFNQLPFVQRVALIGLPSHEMGQKAALIVEPKNKGFVNRILKKKTMMAEISNFCRTHHLNIDEIHFCRYIPLDPRHNTKIDYEKIRHRYH